MIAEQRERECSPAQTGSGKRFVILGGIGMRIGVRNTFCFEHHVSSVIVMFVGELQFN